MITSLIRSESNPPPNKRSLSDRPQLQQRGAEISYSDSFDQLNDGESVKEDPAPGAVTADENSPLLPVFAAPHLDSIPVYQLVHDIRAEINDRVDTTLTWDQLRSPQVSSFLVKPILRRLEKPPVSKGILYALMANCLQFKAESDESPGNASVYQTRSMLCELLALKLLREFSTLELIDVLSYDFYPLQGMPSDGEAEGDSLEGPSRVTPQFRSTRVARVSTLEIAVRAQAKKFLSHPLVVQQIRGIWQGIIVFHSESERNYKAFGHMTWSGSGGNKQKAPEMLARRTASLYNAQQAGVFKLSRLRVPRYRYISSMISLGVLLALYVSVLGARSTEFTTLEALFWIWSFGFMMEELAGFNENGIALYLISLWNSFDMLTYILFLTFYIMRIIAFIVPSESQRISDLSYDVLASCAIFLFPRLFSILDHYEYFSQLIIGFKYMAVDLMSILLLVVIICSGFFVAFTLAFGRDIYSPSTVAFSLFQILMGFTPTAWESWFNYDLTGKILLTIFLFITHFLIFTMLVTVLTNSFAAIMANAHEEHHFLVAVNTITLVKSEALFSYVTPLNLIGWILLPLRSFIAFRNFVVINGLFIRVAHFPILLAIYIYERLILINNSFVSTDSIRNQRAAKLGLKEQSKIASYFNGRLKAKNRKRSDSVDTFQAEVLEEVFRQPIGMFPRARRTGGSEPAPTEYVRTWADTATSNTETGHSEGIKVSSRMRPSQRFASESPTYNSVDRDLNSRNPLAADGRPRSVRSKDSSRSKRKERPGPLGDLGTDAEGNDEGFDFGKKKHAMQDAAVESAVESGPEISRGPSRLNSPRPGSSFISNKFGRGGSRPGTRPGTPRALFRPQGSSRQNSRPGSTRGLHRWETPHGSSSSSSSSGPELDGQRPHRHPTTAAVAAPHIPLSSSTERNNTFSNLPPSHHWSSAPDLARLHDYSQPIPIDHAAPPPPQSRDAAILSSSFETQTAMQGGWEREDVLRRMAFERVERLERGVEQLEEMVEYVKERMREMGWREGL